MPHEINPVIKEKPEEHQNIVNNVNYNNIIAGPGVHNHQPIGIINFNDSDSEEQDVRI